MRVYKDWGVCSSEEHKMLVLADRIYRNQHPERVKGKPSEYSIKPPVLKARHPHKKLLNRIVAGSIPGTGIERR